MFVACHWPMPMPAVATRECRWPLNYGAIDARHDQAGSWNDINEPAKRDLESVQIFVNIRMIEFDVLQQHNPRKVVQKLRAFVEEGGVVFITFDNEIRSIRELKAFAEILSDAAHKK
jgi:hypothetical protein